MKTGFFASGYEDSQDYLEQFVGSDGRELEGYYQLHGVCHEFALALNELFGYDIVLWLEYSSEINSDVVVHAFAMTDYKGVSHYIDARGITDDIEDVISEFDYAEELVDPYGHDRSSALRVLGNLGLSTNVSEDVYALISAQRRIYQF